jgi:AbrB family looped-hinge helix DNA binding protein
MLEMEVAIMPVAKVSNKGQITLPIAARRKLGIAPNSTVEVVTEGNEIVVRPIKSISQLYGVFHEHVRGRKPIGWESERRRMEQAVAQEVVNE